MPSKRVSVHIGANGDWNIMRNFEVCKQCDNFRMGINPLTGNYFVRIKRYRCFLYDGLNAGKKEDDFIKMEMSDECKYYFEHTIMVQDENIKDM